MYQYKIKFFFSLIDTIGFEIKSEVKEIVEEFVYPSDQVHIA